MTAITNTENLRQHKSRISEILEQKPAFASSSNMVREVKIKSPNSELLNILIRIDRPSNSNKHHTQIACL